MVQRDIADSNQDIAANELGDQEKEIDWDAFNVLEPSEDALVEYYAPGVPVTEIEEAKNWVSIMKQNNHPMKMKHL